MFTYSQTLDFYYNDPSQSEDNFIKGLANIVYDQTYYYPFQNKRDLTVI
jgi:hypothetical protein